MPKPKTTYEHAKNFIEDKGFELLTPKEDYENSRTVLLIKCSEGHEFKKDFSEFKQRSRCKYCSIHNRTKKQRYSYDYVKEYIESYGYELLDEYYERNNKKLNLVCPNKHSCQLSFSCFLSGERCHICSREEGAKKRKKSYGEVKKYIEKEGYKLLDEEYVNAHTKMNLECPQGHQIKINFNKFSNGRRCYLCSRERTTKKKRHTHDYIKEIIESYDYKLLSTYSNNNEKMELQCPYGHRFYMNWAAFGQGQRCPECATLRNKHSYDFVKEQFEKEEYVLLDDEYNICNEKLNVVCPHGHEVRISFYNFFIRNTRCPVCDTYKKSSRSETEVYEFVSSILKHYSIIPNERNTITNPYTNRPLELDIWIPILNKSIEFNGIYWHSDYGTIERDKIKKNECEKQGIDLLVIDESDWLKDKFTELKRTELFLKE